MRERTPQNRRKTIIPSPRSGSTSGFLVGLALLAFVAVSFAGVMIGRQYAWTGFGPTVTANGKIIPGKTLWDWLDLLIIPATLVAVGSLINVTERRQERRIANSRTREERQIAEDQQQEAALQTYLERMGRLLIENGLRTANREVEVVARAFTLTALRRLDGARKGEVIRFLSESSLLRGGDIDNQLVVSLVGADLRGANLRGADLQGADLQGADLDGADLQGADLDGARGITESQIETSVWDAMTRLPISLGRRKDRIMNRQVEVERLQGQGVVRLPDGSEVPSGYDVRVLETQERVVTNQGEAWVPTGFTSYRCALQHGGKLHAPLDNSGNLLLVMSDGRQLELLWKTYNLQYGVTEVLPTGGILPARGSDRSIASDSPTATDGKSPEHDDSP